MSSERCSLRSDANGKKETPSAAGNIYPHKNDPPPPIFALKSVLNTCGKCDNVIGSEQSLSCFLCTKWFHLTCTDLTKSCYNAIKNAGDSIEFFCSNCVNIKNDVFNYMKSMFFCKNIFQKSEENEVKHCVEVVEAVKDEIKSEIKNLQVSVKNCCSDDKVPSEKITFAKVLKNKAKALNEKKENPSQEMVNNEPFIIFVKNYPRDKFKNSVSFKLSVAQFFGKRKIEKCYMKNNGVINIFLENQEDADFLEKNWSSWPHANESSVISLKNLKSKNQKFSAIIKDVPPEFLDASLLNTIKNDFSTVTEVKRFVSKASKNLPIVKVDFASEIEKNQFISKGMFYEDIYLKAEEYLVIKKPTYCFRCWKPGHYSKFCKNDPICKKCGCNEHTVNDCHSKPCCINCKGEHYPDDIKCSIYQSILKQENKD